MKLILILIIILSSNLCAQNYWEQIYYKYHYDTVLNIESFDTTSVMVAMEYSSTLRLIESTDKGETWNEIINDWFSIHDPVKPEFWFFRNMQYVKPGYLFFSYREGYIVRASREGIKLDTHNVGRVGRSFFMLDSVIGLFEYGGDLNLTTDGWYSKRKMSPDDKEKLNIKDVWMWDSLNFSFISSRGDIGDFYYRTTDGGKEWIIDSVAGAIISINDLYFFNNQIGWLAGSEKTGIGQTKKDILFKTEDGGNTWERNYYVHDKAIPWGLQYIKFIDEMNGVAVGQFDKILRTTDGGDSWFKETGKDEEFDFDDQPVLRIGAVGDRFILGTFTQGLWSLTDTPISVGEQQGITEPAFSPIPFTTFLICHYRKISPAIAKFALSTWPDGR